MIMVNSLGKTYGKHVVLDGLSATFAPGNVYGIVGPNGAGKTTFFRCLANLAAFSGSIEAPERQLRDRLGYLPTQNYFPEFMTGREYLRLLAHARRLPVPDLDAENVFELPLDNYASQYSTGMQKKLALAGVLLQRNEVLILDEPFNGVDIASNLLISAIIAELRRLGKTVLISSHVFSTLREVCDEILVLAEGRFRAPVRRAGFAELEREMVGMTTGGMVERLTL